MRYFCSFIAWWNSVMKFYSSITPYLKSSSIMIFFTLRLNKLGYHGETHLNAVPSYLQVNHCLNNSFYSILLILNNFMLIKLHLCINVSNFISPWRNKHLCEYIILDERKLYLMSGKGGIPWKNRNEHSKYWLTNRRMHREQFDTTTRGWIS